MPNTQRLLKALEVRQSKAEDEAEGLYHKQSNDYYYKKGIADGLEISQLIVKKVDKEEKKEGRTTK